ncbi:InlB B-repeat-containing protein [Treponema sp. R80B11-R83G3]
MKNVFRFLGVIALVAVIGFSIVACGDGGGGGGDNPVTGGGTVYFGTTLTITNEQVYTMNDQGNTVTYTPYTGNLTLEPDTSDISGTATITNGKLSFSIGTPDELYAWDVFLQSFFSLYSNVTTTDASVKSNMHNGFYDDQYTLNKEKTTRVNNTSGILEHVFYIYVDKDVTVKGTGKTTSIYGINMTTTNVSLALRTGWNAVYQKMTATYSSNSISETQTMSLGNPSGINWVLEDDDDDHTGTGTGTGTGNGTGTGTGTGNMTWTAVTNSPFGTSYINAIAYGGPAGQEKFVAAGYDGKMAYSSNGITWQAVTDSKFTSIIKAIAYGGGTFVAVGFLEDKVAYSSSGINWTSVEDFKLGYLNAIAYGGTTGQEQFVAGGYSGRMVHSSDGVTWESVTDSKFEDETIEAIAYGGGKFVAVGVKGKMAYSEDGINWMAVTDNTFGTNYIESIAYGGPAGQEKFVAGDWDGKMAYSSNGTTWTAVTNSTFRTINSINAIAYGGGKFVAGTDGGGKMAYSSDGITWTAVAYNKFDGIFAIAYGNGTFVAVGDDGKIAYSTGNGTGTGTGTGTGSGNTTYAVTVNGGSGSGSYTAGATVSISATVQSGQTFTSWTVTSGGATLANANSASTTFTMPANAVTVTANFTGGTGGTGGNESNPILLTPDTWVDGSITSTTSGSTVWYSFNVTSGTTYYVWWNDGDQGSGKSLDVKVSAYYSNGSFVLLNDSYSSSFSNLDRAWDTSQTFTASSSGTVKLKVVPYSSGNTGTFAIAYSSSNNRPDITWNSNTLSAGVTDTYRFYANSGNTYCILWQDKDNSSYTADIKVGLKIEGSSSYVVPVEDRRSTNNFTFTVSTSGYYIIVVQGYGANDYGTYRVGYY